MILEIAELRELDAKIAVSVFGYKRFISKHPELAKFGYCLGPSWWIDHPDNAYAEPDAPAHQGVYEAVPCYTTDPVAFDALWSELVAQKGVGVEFQESQVTGCRCEISRALKYDHPVKRGAFRFGQTRKVALGLATVAACED